MNMLLDLLTDEALSNGVVTTKEYIKNLAKETELNKNLVDYDQRFIQEHESEIDQYKTNVDDIKKNRKSLISIAKENELFISPKEWMRFGDRKRLPSGESIVYLNPQGNRIIKVRNPFAKSAIKQLHAQDAIYEHLIHNLFFPSTRYHFEGISEDVDGVRIILSQPYISDKYFAPTQVEIDNYLIEKLGLKIEDRYFYGNEHIAITDVSAEGDNVLSDEEQLYFIDPIIKMKRPAIEVLDYYYQFLK